MQPDERRRFSRWEIGWHVKFRFGTALLNSDGRILDINLKGMQLVSSIELPQDSFLKLTVLFSEDFTLDVDAWIVWHKNIEGHNIYGIYFAKIKDADKELIYQFMRKHFSAEVNKKWWEGLRVEKPKEIAKGGENMEDRRTFSRFPVKLPFKFLDLKTNKEGFGKTSDVSTKGLGLETEQEFPNHTPVEIWLAVPDKGGPLYLRGEVVWSERLGVHKYKVGVSLEKADVDALSRILTSI